MFTLQAKSDNFFKFTIKITPITPRTDIGFELRRGQQKIQKLFILAEQSVSKEVNELVDTSLEGTLKTKNNNTLIEMPRCMVYIYINSCKQFV